MAHERALYAYMLDLIRNMSSILLRIGGMPEHLHLALDLNPMISVSEFMKSLKEFSSKWLANNPNYPLFKSWGEGYTAFSYSVAEKDINLQLLKHQKGHHLKQSFADEYCEFIIRNDCLINERFLMKD